MMSRTSLQLKKVASGHKTFDDNEIHHRPLYDEPLYEDAPTDGDHPWFHDTISIKLVLSDETTAETSSMEIERYPKSSMLHSRISDAANEHNA